MRTNSYGATHPGRKRDRNEDFFLIEPELGLNIVCDGVGGHSAGQLASKTAAETILKFVSENRSVVRDYHAVRTLDRRAAIATMIQNAIQEANRRVYDVAQEDPHTRGMCTTAVVMITLEDSVVVGHVGDSRAYIIRGGKSHQLTADHKFKDEAVRKGLLTAEAAAKLPNANVLIRAVGHNQVVEVDTLQIEAQPGDRFVLCSDGLVDYLDKGDLVHHVEGDQATAPDRLIQLANSRGGKDNITVITAELSKEAARPASAFDVFQKLELVGKVPLFRYLDYREINKVLSIAEFKSFDSGTYLATENSKSEEMLIIASGRVRVLKDRALVAEIGKGGLVGEMGIFDRAPRSASVQAVEPTRTLSIERVRILTLMRQDSFLAVKLLWALLHLSNEKIRNLTQSLAMSEATPTKQTEILPFSMGESDSSWRDTGNKTSG